MFKQLTPSLLALGTMFASGQLVADTNTHRWQYEDVFNLEYAAAPEIHPDGHLVIYERRAMDIMTDSTRTNLWQYDLDKNQHTPVFSSKANYRSARFSPDGSRLAYIASNEGDTQLYIRWIETGVTTRVTNVHKGISNISWSPDGKWLAFSMLKESKPASIFNEMPKKPAGAKWAGTAKYIDQMSYRSDGRGFLPSGYQHIYVVPSEGGTPRQVTTGDFHHGGSIAWSKDGLSLFISGDRHPDWQDRPRESDIYRVSVKTGETENITNRPGPDNSPKLSPDGKKIAYLRFDDKKLSSQNSDIYVMNSDGSKSLNLTQELDRPISQPKWDKKGRGIYFTYDDFGQKYVGYVSLKGKIRKKLAKLGGQSLGRPYTSGEYAVGKNNTLVVTLANNQRPADLAIVKKGKVQQITRLNEDILAHKQTAEVFPITVKSSVDGRDIEAWYALPPEFDKTKKYPLILEIHGGPHTAYGPNFSTEVQLMAAKGYVVVWANPRGSTSYGEEFANLIHHNYPSQDYNDLMDVVDGMVAKSYIDKENLFVTGGSGGGVLTAWIIGKTDRFKAAVVAKPVINWLSFALTANRWW